MAFSDNLEDKIRDIRIFLNTRQKEVWPSYTAVRDRLLLRDRSIISRQLKTWVRYILGGLDQDQRSTITEIMDHQTSR